MWPEAVRRLGIRPSERPRFSVQHGSGHAKSPQPEGQGGINAEPDGSTAEIVKPYDPPLISFRYRISCRTASAYAVGSLPQLDLVRMAGAGRISALARISFSSGPRLVHLSLGQTPFHRQFSGGITQQDRLTTEVIGGVQIAFRCLIWKHWQDAGPGGRFRDRQARRRNRGRLPGKHRTAAGRQPEGQKSGQGQAGRSHWGRSGFQ